MENVVCVLSVVVGGDTVVARHRGEFLFRAGQSDKRRIKLRHERGEWRGGIAPWIDGNEEYLPPLGIGSEEFHRLRQPRERGSTDVATMDEAEKQHHCLALEVGRPQAMKLLGPDAER